MCIFSVFSRFFISVTTGADPYITTKSGVFPIDLATNAGGFFFTYRQKNLLTDDMKRS